MPRYPSHRVTALPRAVLASLLILSLAPLAARAHDPLLDLPPPMSVPEAWNVINASLANINTCLETNQFREVSYHVANCSPAIRLLQAKLPLALPVVMLGLNQTIMAALSMLAIAALVGTRDLGQQVYVALGKADAGMGLVAGLSIAFLAILADRLIQAWVGSKVGHAGEI